MASPKANHAVLLVIHNTPHLFHFSVAEPDNTKRDRKAGDIYLRVYVHYCDINKAFTVHALLAAVNATPYLEYIHTETMISMTKVIFWSMYTPRP